MTIRICDHPACQRKVDRLVIFETIYGNPPGIPPNIKELCEDCWADFEEWMKQATTRSAAELRAEFFDVEDAAEVEVLEDNLLLMTPGEIDG